MAKDTTGLSGTNWPNTWVSAGNHPIVLANDARGGLHSVSGSAGDQLPDIPGGHLQDGMLAYVTTEYEGVTPGYYKYVPQADDTRLPGGALPNSADHWEAFTSSSDNSDLSVLYQDDRVQIGPDVADAIRLADFDSAGNAGVVSAQDRRRVLDSMGVYKPNTGYPSGVVVEYNNAFYRSTSIIPDENTVRPDSTSAVKPWEYLGSMVIKFNTDADRDYEIDSVVEHDGELYKALRQVTSNVSPGDTTQIGNWQRLADRGLEVQISGATSAGTGSFTISNGDFVQEIARGGGAIQLDAGTGVTIDHDDTVPNLHKLTISNANAAPSISQSSTVISSDSLTFNINDDSNTFTISSSIPSGAGPGQAGLISGLDTAFLRDGISEYTGTRPYEPGQYVIAGQTIYEARRNVPIHDGSSLDVGPTEGDEWISHGGTVARWETASATIGARDYDTNSVVEYVGQLFQWRSNFPVSNIFENRPGVNPGWRLLNQRGHTLQPVDGVTDEQGEPIEYMLDHQYVSDRLVGDPITTDTNYVSFKAGDGVNLDVETMTDAAGVADKTTLIISADGIPVDGAHAGDLQIGDFNISVEPFGSYDRGDNNFFEIDPDENTLMYTDDHVSDEVFSRSIFTKGNSFSSNGRIVLLVNGPVGPIPPANGGPVANNFDTGDIISIEVSYGTGQTPVANLPAGFYTASVDFGRFFIPYDGFQFATYNPDLGNVYTRLTGQNLRYHGNDLSSSVTASEALNNANPIANNVRLTVRKLRAISETVTYPTIDHRVSSDSTSALLASIPLYGKDGIEIIKREVGGTNALTAAESGRTAGDEYIEISTPHVDGLEIFEDGTLVTNNVQDPRTSHYNRWNAIDFGPDFSTDNSSNQVLEVNHVAREATLQVLHSVNPEVTDYIRGHDYYLRGTDVITDPSFDVSDYETGDILPNGKLFFRTGPEGENSIYITTVPLEDNPGPEAFLGDHLVGNVVTFFLSTGQADSIGFTEPIQDVIAGVTRNDFSGVITQRPGEPGAYVTDFITRDGTPTGDLLKDVTFHRPTDANPFTHATIATQRETNADSPWIQNTSVRTATSPETIVTYVDTQQVVEGQRTAGSTQVIAVYAGAESADYTPGEVISYNPSGIKAGTVLSSLIVPDTVYEADGRFINTWSAGIGENLVMFDPGAISPEASPYTIARTGGTISPFQQDLILVRAPNNVFDYPPQYFGINLDTYTDTRFQLHPTTGDPITHNGITYAAGTTFPARTTGEGTVGLEWFVYRPSHLEITTSVGDTVIPGYPFRNLIIYKQNVEVDQVVSTSFGDSRVRLESSPYVTATANGTESIQLGLSNAILYGAVLAGGDRTKRYSTVDTINQVNGTSGGVGLTGFTTDAILRIDFYEFYSGDHFAHIIRKNVSGAQSSDMYRNASSDDFSTWVKIHTKLDRYDVVT